MIILKMNKSPSSKGAGKNAKKKLEDKMRMAINRHNLIRKATLNQSLVLKETTYSDLQSMARREPQFRFPTESATMSECASQEPLIGDQAQQ